MVLIILQIAKLMSLLFTSLFRGQFHSAEKLQEGEEFVLSGEFHLEFIWQTHGVSNNVYYLHCIECDRRQAGLWLVEFVECVFREQRT